jgi:hypothetical protein
VHGSCYPDALTRPIYVGFTTSQLLGRVPKADSTGRKFLVVGGPSGMGGWEVTVPARSGLAEELPDEGSGL